MNFARYTSSKISLCAKTEIIQHNRRQTDIAKQEKKLWLTGYAVLQMISKVLTHPLACKRRSELVKASKSAADLTGRRWGYSSCTLDCANSALITAAKCTWRIRATSPTEPVRGHLLNYYSITAPRSELNE